MLNNGKPVEICLFRHRGGAQFRLVQIKHHEEVAGWGSFPTQRIIEHKRRDSMGQDYWTSLDEATTREALDALAKVLCDRYDMRGDLG